MPNKVIDRLKREAELWQVISAAIVLLAPFAVIVYDILAYRLGGRDSTITSVIQWFTLKFPELPALAAAIFVWLWLHLFLQGVIESVYKRHPPESPAAVKNGQVKGE